MESSSPHQLVPDSWLALVEAYQQSVQGMESAAISSRVHREQLKSIINTCRDQLNTTPKSISLPPGTSDEIRKHLAEWLRVMRDQQKQLLFFMDQMIDDIEHAQENENRFIILVFGEVNCGKSAIGNHFAGLDFEIDYFQRGNCFSGPIDVKRLEESPVECTRDYQGFRLPGLLWIDCPGVLSRTFTNAQLARRLVSRADFILFVSSSDAPLKQSELRELKSMIEQSGNKDLSAALIISKADLFHEEEDPLHERIVRCVKKKALNDLQAQIKWCREQASKSGISKQMRIGSPIVLSTYVARDSMGRDWINGTRRSKAKKDWQLQYADSGYPQLFTILETLVRKHGKALKASWPLKRKTALANEFDRAISISVDGLKKIRKRVIANERTLWKILPDAQAFAAEQAAAAVRKALVSNGINNIKTFKSENASKELAKSLKANIERTLNKFVEQLIVEYQQEMRAVLDSYVDTLTYELNVEEIFTYKTYESTQKSEGVGRGAGALGGSLAGAAAGFSIGGPIGAFIGGVVGGIFGSLAGAKAAKQVYKETVKVKISTGTNAEEVIKRTQSKIKTQSKLAVLRCFNNIDDLLYKPVLKQTASLERKVQSWKVLFSETSDTAKK